MLVNVDLSDSPVLIPRTEGPKEMISIGERDGKTLVRINSSSVSIIQECMRKARLSLYEKWHGENESPATVFGSAVHKALEVFYSSTHEERKLPSFEDMELMSYGNKHWDEDTDVLLRATRAFIERAKPLEALPESDKRSIQTGVWMLWHYFRTYIDDPYITYVDEKGPFVERPFSFLLYEDESLLVEYFGTIDLVVRHAGTGELLVCDHKTSSVVGNDFYNRLKPNHQYTGYLLGANRAFNLSTNSFLVNCLQVKEKPKTSRGSPPHFPRQITTRDEYDYKEFKDAVVEAAFRYLQEPARNRWSLGNVNACATYGGCQYLSVCAAPNSLRENVLKSKFIQGDAK